VDIRRARAAIKQAQELLDEARASLRRTRRRVVEEPPVVDDVPERDPPDTNGEGGDVEPPPPPRTDLYRAPVYRKDPVKPSRAHGEYDGSVSLADLYRSIRSRQRGDEGVVLTVKAHTGGFGIGSDNGLWGTDEHPIDLTLVSDRGSFTVGPFGPSFGGTDVPVRKFHCFGLGIKANPDSFVIRQGGPVGDTAFVDWWMEPYKPGFVHTSGLHLQRGWTSLTLKGYRPRLPDGTPVRFSEHIAYLKGGGPLQILDNELMGGNRTGFQIRPHGEGFISYHFNASPRPTGHVIIEGNHSDGYGWDHENPSGGACLTVGPRWSTLW
jgi:hypothetical protein